MRDIHQFLFPPKAKLVLYIGEKVQFTAFNIEYFRADCLIVFAICVRFSADNVF